MDGDYDIWLVDGHHYANQITADITKIAPVRPGVGIHQHRI